MIGASFDPLVLNHHVRHPNLIFCPVSMASSFHMVTAKTSIGTAKSRQLTPQVLESGERESAAVTCSSINQIRTHPIRMQYKIKAPPYLLVELIWYFRPIGERQ